MPKQNKAERQARLRTPEPERPVVKPPTRDELYDQAKALGIKGASKFTRDQLAAAIEAASADVAAQIEEAVAPVQPEPDPTTMAGRQQLGDRRIVDAAQHYADTLADPDAPKAEEDPVKRMMAAKPEQAALKAWQLAGKGERPSTPNYDYIAATYVAGGEGLMPKSKRQRAASNGGGGSRVRTSAGPRGQAGLVEKARIKGKRGEVQREDKAVMEAYIIEMHEAHPESTALDEFRYAYWLDKRGFGKKSFLDTWARLFGGDDQAEPANDAVEQAEAARAEGHKHDGEDVDAALAEQVHAAAKAVAKKTTGAKRGDNLRSKAPAKAAAKSKDVTPITKEAQTRRRSPAKK